MAEEKKDNFLLYVGLATVFMIVVVVLLKKDEVKHLKMSAETTAAAEAQVLSKHKDYNNDIK